MTGREVIITFNPERARW